MKKLLIAATAVSGFLTLSSAAMAADMAMMDTAYDWSGFYIGATAGYGWGDSRHTNDGGATTGDFNIEGFIGGATLGGNWQTGSFVFGVEGDISFSDIDGDISNVCPDCETDIDWLGTVRARGGFAFNELLLFAAGGLAVGDVKAQCCDVSDTETQFGWTIGGGLEWALSEAISVKAEYLFVDLGKIDYPDDSPGPVDAEADETHIVRGGINFHF